MAFRIQRLREGWTREQLELREHSIIEDKDIILEKLSNGTLLVGGLDISYSGIDSTAFVGVSVVTIGNPSLNKQCETLIVDTFKVEIKGFYVPGFLAFREVPAYIEAIEAFKTKYPDGPTPDIWMVDCNGTLHPRRFGAACHLGVKLGEPTLGVAKSLPFIDSTANGFPLSTTGPRQRELIRRKADSLQKDQKIDLYGLEGTLDGVALMNSNSKNPVFVSPGHMVTLETAIEITLRCSIHRVPEPTRQADVKSNADAREYSNSI